MDNCPHCGGIRGQHSSILQGCNCQWQMQSTVPAKGTLLPKREWVGLTDEEIEQGNKESWVDKQAWESAVWWAEAKLKEKNT